MIIAHKDREQEYVDKGYFALWRNGDRVAFVNPEDTCCQGVRGGGFCTLDKGHTGYHSKVTYYCDGCGKSRRGRPYRSNEHVELCFLCVEELI